MQEIPHRHRLGYFAETGRRFIRGSFLSPVSPLLRPMREIPHRLGKYVEIPYLEAAALLRLALW